MPLDTPLAQPDHDYPRRITTGELLERVRRWHHTPTDFSEGDLSERLWCYDAYELVMLPLDEVFLAEWGVDEERVTSYAERITRGEEPPPFVFDRHARSVIDGIHRANAFARVGRRKCLAYVGVGEPDYESMSGEEAEE